MNIKNRIAILAASIVLTFVGFNLLVSPSALSMMRLGKASDRPVVSVAVMYSTSPADAPIDMAS